MRAQSMGEFLGTIRVGAPWKACAVSRCRQDDRPELRSGMIRAQAVSRCHGSQSNRLHIFGILYEPAPTHGCADDYARRDEHGVLQDVLALEG